MTMVLNYSEIDSIRRRFPPNQISQSPAPSLPFDEMPDDMIRPDHTDPDQPNRVDDSWLRLRLGTSEDQRPTSSTSVELDLMPLTTNSQHQRLQQQQVVRNTRPTGFFHIPEFRLPPPRQVEVQLMQAKWTSLHQQQQGQIGNYCLANNQADNSMMPTMVPNFFGRPNFYDNQMAGLNGGGGMRIIRPPRRPHVGVWFMLQASRNQVREPFLPQVPKSYLRIKNGRMTVRLLMKYLVQKLGLESESEVEIRCRGQELQPIFTLQHVRDNIWCTRRDVTLTLNTVSPSSSSTLPSAVAADSHIMILHYARSLLSVTSEPVTTATTSDPIF